MSRVGARPAIAAIAFLPFVAVSVFHLTVKLMGIVELDRWTKGLTMPALLLGVVLWLIVTRRRISGPVLALLVAALALSWLGDVMLPFFVLGLSFFLAAHVAYIVLFHLAFLRRPSWWTVGLIPWFAGLLLALWPYLGELAPIVGIYGAVLGYMATSASRGNALTTIGGALFVASDSLLAFRLFTPLFQTPPEDVIIMGLYLGAQFCIALGVMRTSVPRVPRRAAVGAPA
ncbi:lysoplasmalogenase [Homoserinibacter sp. GY 40078]|uniref:lysoplasmalogenase n=1 Tax=Homoserinibacter sp. GY 40078 TaxID=2603275 RepID=UPI0011CC6388|nr:lysoplasmalogenase [Homoserinibacter sp. GY 40078]TXK17463.1 lysoplasmalogenase [Homoserinibacter sp. GY 40078]